MRGIGLVAGTWGSQTGYYTFNAHGDVTGLTNSGGALTKAYDYDAFGNERTTPDGNDANPFRYCGEYLDGETGSYYLRARYYGPAMGRFLTEDPIRSDLNWYTYCNGNPVAFVDSSGLDAILINKLVDNFTNKVNIEHLGGFFRTKMIHGGISFRGHRVPCRSR